MQVPAEALRLRMLYTEDSDYCIPSDPYYFLWTFFGQEFYEVRAGRTRLGVGQTLYFNDLPSMYCLIWA